MCLAKIRIDPRLSEWPERRLKRALGERVKGEEKNAYFERAGADKERVPLASAAKPLKRLKMAMGSYSFGAISACVWRHIRSGSALYPHGLAPCPLGVGATFVWGRRDHAAQSTSC
jgi:hypothetical protein